MLTACAVLALAAPAGADSSGTDPLEPVPDPVPVARDAGPLWPTRTVVRCEAKRPGPDGRPQVVEVPLGGKLVHPQRLADLVLAAGTDLPVCRDDLAQCRATPPTTVKVPTGDSWAVRAGLVAAGIAAGALAVALAR